MNKQQRMKAELKVVRALKYWEDADFFSLDVKKKIAEMVVAELDEFFGFQERGLQWVWQCQVKLLIKLRAY